MTHLNSFDLIRTVAALMVLVSHSFPISGNPEYEVLTGWTAGRLGVAIFFTLSGYLVFQSLERDKNVYRFLARRFLRIFPGLAAMLLVTVFVIGPLVTTISFVDYLSTSDTYQYLGKIRLWGNDRLPGVFENNHFHGTVNGSLWTLKIEWLMYCMLPTILFIKLNRWRLYVTILTMSFVVLSLLSDEKIYALYFPVAGVLSPLSNPFLNGSFFMLGAWYALHGRSLTLRNALIISMLLLLCSLTLPVSPYTKSQLILWATIPAVVIFVGESSLSRALRIPLSKDISYGLYIYAFPVQQSTAFFCPDATWWQSLVISIPITSAIAYTSWIFIEEPALRIKKYLVSNTQSCESLEKATERKVSA